MFVSAEHRQLTYTTIFYKMATLRRIPIFGTYTILLTYTTIICYHAAHYTISIQNVKPEPSPNPNLCTKNPQRRVFEPQLPISSPNGSQGCVSDHQQCVFEPLP